MRDPSVSSAARQYDRVMASEPQSRRSSALDRAAIRYAVRRTWHGFIRHRDLDSAAALTFFSALSVFPATLAIVSGLALFDPAGQSVKLILDVVGRMSNPTTKDAVRAVFSELSSFPNAGATLAGATVITLWTVSGYATAFGRAMNNVYEVVEGRRMTKNRLLMMIVAAGLIVCLAVMGAIVLITPSIAAAIAASLGWPAVVATLWSVLKWFILAILAVFTVAFLYFGTPNFVRPRLRWLSVGASFTIVTWTIAAGGYALYLSNFSRYDQLYGWLAIPIVTLLWLYLSNIVLVLGVEVDAELVRARQLLAGIPAEENIRIHLRDTRRNIILAARDARDISDGRAIREAAAKTRGNSEYPDELSLN